MVIERTYDFIVMNRGKKSRFALMRVKAFGSTRLRIDFAYALIASNLLNILPKLNFLVTFFRKRFYRFAFEFSF